MDEAGLRLEMMDHLESYLQGQSPLGGLLEWEAGLSLSPDTSERMRADLDRIALIGEEVESGLRDERELFEAARGILDGMGARAGAS